VKKIDLLWLLALVGVMAGCGGDPNGAQIATQTALQANPNPIVEATRPPLTTLAPAVPTQTPLPVDAAGEPLVARVNGMDITVTEFRRGVARLQLDPSMRANPEAIRTAVLQTLIEQVIIEQEAGKVQIAVSDAEVDAEISKLETAAGSPDTWRNWLEQNLYTEQEFRRSLYSSLMTNRMRDHIIGTTDQPVPQVHARHILVATRDEANSLLVLMRNGQDFAALAANISLDVTSRPIGGDLGWFTRGELLENELTEIAFELEPGQIAGPIQTALGYHIIQTLEKEVRPIPEEKQAMLSQTRFEQWLAVLIESAVIEQYI